MAVLDDVEDFAVAAIFERVGIGEVGDLELHVCGQAAFAVAAGAVTHGAVEGPPLLGAGQRFGDDLTDWAGGRLRPGWRRKRASCLGLGRRLLGGERGQENDCAGKSQSESGYCGDIGAPMNVSHEELLRATTIEFKLRIERERVGAVTWITGRGLQRRGLRHKRARGSTG